MEVKHKTKRKWRFSRKRLTAAAVLLTIVCFVSLGVQYLSFVSRTVYEESTEHLEEILHKSNSMLSMIVNKNISYLHLWNGFLDSNPGDDGILTYLESAKQELDFAEFYFPSYDGNYITPLGETGYLGLPSNFDEKLAEQNDVVINAVLPGQDPMLVFICPETKGVYRGFAYDAIAISRYNDVVMKTVDDSAFGGAASTYVIYPDGRVVVENIAEDAESIYNLLAVLREYSDFNEVQMHIMDGYTATRRIRELENPALAGIPILAMTANAFDEDRRNALESGMNGFLSKPIVIAYLVQEMRKIL